ncbi:2-oxoglutarate dehydrogenase complex dihydrolipoyllysine-residue succinyltransferase [Alicyclobacillus ferrooxydans]|uniref:Dihydrolipoyllysine-residue succinyltransferase component of 2-oxoglutarate dehydrogenase complex n=1 Tax=Alicyclobacillus ferrooxydans TaxID=471514 RepID=A0A0P9EKC2_9BACL|nr:2-oxoglutarate dehydrogenase complex dihydrolipoyllysine-residue succinyltransferase [Alicyclobacillus ferrooxydans]KPV43543.1 dihydrolipoamide succinyltransferase [Alicyclobacillus ferrooxydans]
MAELRVPELGESIVEATVGTWLKNVGDSVTAGEAVVELETDKVNVEVMSEVDGVLSAVHHAAGATVAPGDVLGEVGNEAVAQASTSTEVSTPASAAQSVTEAAIAKTEAAQKQQPVPAAAPMNLTEQQAASSRNLPPRATPAVRRMASEHGVALSGVAGSGGQGRITPVDIVQQTGTVQSAPNPASKAAPAVPVQQEPSRNVATVTDRPEEHVRLSRRRLTIAKRLVEAQHTAAMLTTFNEIDMTAVMDVRKRRKDAFRDKHGVGLGFMSFFTKAVVGALKSQPALNAEIRGEEMIVKHYYDIGIAVATEAGLVVPVVRDADRKSFAEIEQEIASLAARARNNALSLEDLRGGTFTITNGGTFGSLLSTPILNPPQVGILGMHKIQERPVGVNGNIELRPMMYVALSYDHRIVDGAEAVRFLVRVKELLEDPEQLLLEG